MNRLKRKLIANLQNYLRERQSFIASIPTMDPIWTAPLSLTGYIIKPILGVLNNEGEEVDDNGKCPFLFLLFDNIVRSENIRACAIKFLVKIFSRTGKREYKYYFDIDEGQIQYKVESNNTSEQEFKAAIYLGTSGCHAFYSLVENTLRNIARHSSKKALEKVQEYSKKFTNQNEIFNSGKPILITIEFHYDDNENEEFKEDFIKVKIYDNMGEWKKKNNGIWVLEEKENGKTKLKLVVFETGMDENEAKKCLKKYFDKNEREVEKELNGKIFNKKLSPKYSEGRIIDETGKLIEGGWGLKEMRVCASFLRGIKIEDYEVEQNPPVITPIIKEGNLGVEFYIPKVKDLLVISKDVWNYSNNRITELKNQGVYIEKDISKVDEFLKRGTFTHEFVAIDIDEDQNVEFLKDNILKLPYKLFYLTSKENGDEIKEIDERADKKTIKKEEFESWFSSKDEFKVNDISIEVENDKKGSLKSAEKVILEIRKKWIQYLLDNSTLPKVGFYPFTLKGKEWSVNNLIFCEESKPKNSHLSQSFLQNIDGNILLLHRFDHYNEIKSKKPLSILPFAHGVSSPITKIKMNLQNSKGKKWNFDTLTSYFDALEAGITNVVIIDERICDESKSIKNIFRKINFSLFWYLQNIVILNLDKKENIFTLTWYKLNTQGELHQEVQAKEIKMDEENEKLQSFIPKSFQNKLHFLIIHHTIISPKIGGKEEFEKFINLIQEKYKPWYVVVTSGRGHPPRSDMPKIKFPKFLDFSDLRRSIINTPDKLLLARILSNLKEKE